MIGKNMIFKAIVFPIIMIGFLSCGYMGLRTVDNKDNVVSQKASSGTVCINHKGEPINAQDYFTIIDYLNKIDHSESTHIYAGLGDALVHNDGLIDEIIYFAHDSASTDTKHILINGLVHCLLDYAKDYCERVNG